MKKIGRTLRVGFVVGLIFFGWYMREVYFRNWKFRLFSASDWQYVWKQFKSGWVIQTSYEWSWLLTVALMIPVFIVLWWVSVKISWRKSFMTVFRKIKNFFFRPNAKKVIRKKIKLKTKASHKKVRPAPMVAVGRPAVKHTGRTMDAGDMSGVATTSAPPRPNIPMEDGGFNVPHPMFENTENPIETGEEMPAFLNEEISNMPIDSIQLPERIRLEENLADILSAANYQVVENATIGKLKTNYVGISAERVVLCLTDTEKGDWLADEEFFNDEEPLWFSENSHRISPVYALLTAAKGFAKKGTDKGLTQEVMPILVEKDGTIINAPDMIETWKKMGVVVCRTDLGGPEELPSFGMALPKASDKGAPELVEIIQSLF